MIEKGKIQFVLSVVERDNYWCCWSNGTEIGRFTETIDGESNFEFLDDISNFKALLVIMAEQGVDLDDPKLQASIFLMYEHLVHQHLELHPNIEIF